jgi:hypothetical protein
VAVDIVQEYNPTCLCQRGRGDVDGVDPHGNTSKVAIVLARKDCGDMYYLHSHKKANDKYIVASAGLECLGMLSLRHPQTDIKERKSLTNLKMVTKI